MRSILHICGLAALLLFAAYPTMLPAQDLTPCEIDLLLLKTPIRTDFSRAEPGKVYYLSPDFVQSHDQVDLFGSVAAYYEYLRPATRRELRQDTIKAVTIARILNDGNVYKQVSIEQTTGFFQANKHFQGNFHPLEREPKLLLPKGLVPFDVLAHRDDPFVLRELQDAYWLFDCQGQRVVVYATADQLAGIFQSDEARNLLKRKKTYARSLIGLEVRLSYTRTAGPRFIDLELADCRVTDDYVIFSYWAGDAGYLFLNGDTRFFFYEKACAKERDTEQITPTASLSENARSQLNEVIRQKNPAKRMQENPVLLKLLMDQFELAKDNYAGITWYLHKGLTPDQTSKSSFLRANLNSNGILYLQSNYFSATGMGHTTVAVSSMGEETKTVAVPTSESRNMRVESEEGIEEQIHFTKGDDQDVIAFIAHHVADPIQLTFINETGQEESLPLSENHKQAIRDVYVLYLMLK